MALAPSRQFRFAVHALWSRVPELWTLGIVSAYEDFYMAFDSGVGGGVFYLLGDV